MMSSDNKCFVCRKKGHICHQCPQAQCYNCDAFGHFAQDCPKKIAPSGTHVITTDLTPTHIVTTATGTGHTPSITDTTKGTILIGQDHISNPSMTEALVTTSGMHSSLYLTMIAVVITPQQTGTLEDIPTGIPDTNTGTKHLVTYHARVTPNTTPLIIVGPVLGTPGALPMDHSPVRYQCHIQGEKPPYTPAQQECHYSGLANEFLVRIR